MVALLAVGFGVTAARAGPTPADKCEAGKNKEAGKYAYCRQKAEGKFVLTGDTSARITALDKCVAKWTLKWGKLETNAAGACPTVGDVHAMNDVVIDHAANVAKALGGGDLANQGRRLKSGQTACWDPDDITVPISVVSCSGTGQDGELQFESGANVGLSRVYVPNGDGTVTDRRTGLTWEKLSNDGDSLHDVDNTYTWAEAFDKIAALNSSSFANRTDWRLPNVNELQSLVDYGAVDPAVSSAFHFPIQCAQPGCTVITCSCTASFNYWSSTTYENGPGNAWLVDFFDGHVIAFVKNYDYHVRAVRGGS